MDPITLGIGALLAVVVGKMMSDSRQTTSADRAQILCEKLKGDDELYANIQNRLKQETPGFFEDPRRTEVLNWLSKHYGENKLNELALKAKDLKDLAEIFISMIKQGYEATATEEEKRQMARRLPSPMAGEFVTPDGYTVLDPRTLRIGARESDGLEAFILPDGRPIPFDNMPPAVVREIVELITYSRMVDRASRIAETAVAEALRDPNRQGRLRVHIQTNGRVSERYLLFFEREVLTDVREVMITVDLPGRSR